MYSLLLNVNNQSGSMANWLECQSCKREVHVMGSSPNVGKTFFSFSSFLLSSQLNKAITNYVKHGIHLAKTLSHPDIVCIRLFTLA